MRSLTRRAALAVCVALLLVTAGCSNGTTPTSTATTTSGTTTTTSTDTTTSATSATTTTTTGTWAPNASVEQYPPGVADNGTLANVTTLLDAHFDATANRSMELTIESPRDDYVRSLTHGANPTPYYSTYNRTNGGMRITEEFYGAGSQGFDRAAWDNETLYRVYQNNTIGVSAWTEDSPIGPRHTIRAWLTGGNYSVNGTVERGGRTFVQLTADELSPEPGFVTRYDGTVLVTSDGVVHDIDASANRSTGEDTEERIEVSVTLDTDVEWTGPPSWVADVPHLSLSIVEDGHAVEIRNTGGAALPANASFKVGGNNETAMDWLSIGDEIGTVTTDAPLEPGDAIYVTASAGGDPASLTLHDEPTRGEYTFVTATVRGTHESVDYQLVTSDESRERARETTSGSN